MASTGQICAQLSQPITQFSGFWTVGCLLSSSHPNTSFLQKSTQARSPVQAS